MPLQFSQARSDVYVPDGSAAEAALGRISHLCVAAHQDDIEIMAHAAIVDCIQDPNASFGGVVVTNGSGSPRTGRYSGWTDEQMVEVRREEQRRAAQAGKYGIQIQLDHPSSAVKSANAAARVRQDLIDLFNGCRPRLLIVHNPADKHDTHVGVFLRTLEALRSLPLERRPERVLGAEVWRDLDWLVDADKVALDSGREPALAADLLCVFESQISGGKRYDLATLGRRLAHATYHTSHATDRLQGITWAMDLTPLFRDDSLSPEAYVLGYVDRLRTDIQARLLRQN